LDEVTVALEHMGKLDTYGGAYFLLVKKVEDNKLYVTDPGYCREGQKQVI
jgi:hypothetical protein